MHIVVRHERMKTEKRAVDNPTRKSALRTARINRCSHPTRRPLLRKNRQEKKRGRPHKEILRKTQNGKAATTKRETPRNFSQQTTSSSKVGSSHVDELGWGSKNDSKFEILRGYAVASYCNQLHV